MRWNQKDVKDTEASEFMRYNSYCVLEMLQEDEDAASGSSSVSDVRVWSEMKSFMETLSLHHVFLPLCLSDDSNPTLSKDISSAFSMLPDCFDSEGGFPLEDELRIEPLSLDGLSMLSDPDMVLPDPSVEDSFRSDRLWVSRSLHTHTHTHTHTQKLQICLCMIRLGHIHPLPLRFIKCERRERSQDDRQRSHLLRVKFEESRVSSSNQNYSDEQGRAVSSSVSFSLITSSQPAEAMATSSPWLRSIATPSPCWKQQKGQNTIKFFSCAVASAVTVKHLAA